MKKNVVKMLATKMKISENEAKVVLNDVLGCIMDASMKEEDNELRLRGFGSFRLIQQNGRVGNNPKTNEVIQIPPYRKISFIASRNWKKRVNA